MPGLLEFLLAPLQELLELLDHPEVLLATGPVVEQLLELLVLLLHHADPVPIFLHHAAELFLDFLRPLHLLVGDRLDLLLLVLL